MKYLSTRDSARKLHSFCDILLAGLAPDGGLYLPEEYPVVSQSELDRLRTVFSVDGYPGLASEIVGLFVDDIPKRHIVSLTANAYCFDKFQNELVTPVTNISDNLFLAHLSNGPTAAFKDMAMQLLGELFSYELSRRDDFINILGATSGDTGSSAEYAMLGKPNVKVFMLSPAGRMTAFQQAQMFSLDDPGIVNLAVEGVFDDCQDLVKAVNADGEFKAKHHIGAVNSINWARLMAQIVYYFAAWIQVSENSSQPVSFAVPSGNFGNICAGHIARQMGLPIEKLVLATNENNVLEEFFNTGVYRVRSSAETLATSSPSMDISKASNFERFIFDLFDQDAQLVAELFGKQLVDNGYFDLSNSVEFRQLEQRFGFVAGSSTHQDRIATIRRVFKESNVLVDPHTADGIKVGQDFVSNNPMIVLETALPVKFADTIKEAIFQVPPIPERFANLGKERHVRQIPVDVALLKQIVAQEAIRR